VYCNIQDLDAYMFSVIRPLVDKFGFKLTTNYNDIT